MRTAAAKGKSRGASLKTTMAANERQKKMTLVENRILIGMLMSNQTVRGEIILLSIEMEANLDSLLRGYFSFTSKAMDFEQLLLTKLTLSQKIDVLRNLPFRPALKSHSELVSMCASVNRLRNHAAHASWADGEKVYKLADNEFVRKFMVNYPMSIDTTRGRIFRLSAALRRTREYNQNENPDDDIPF